MTTRPEDQGTYASGPKACAEALEKNKQRAAQSQVGREAAPLTVERLVDELTRIYGQREVLISIPEGQRGGDYTLQQSSGQVALTISPDDGPVFIHLGRLKA